MILKEAITLTNPKRRIEMNSFERLSKLASNPRDLEELLEIARSEGLSDRSARETHRIATRAAPALLKAVRETAPARAVRPRVAARLADLPRQLQRTLVPRVRGVSTKVGLRVVQQAEADLGLRRRGRAPGTVTGRSETVLLEQLHRIALDFEVHGRADLVDRVDAIVNELGSTLA